MEMTVREDAAAVAEPLARRRSFPTSSVDEGRSAREERRERDVRRAAVVADLPQARQPQV
jgi:hypothetical protein